jgi:hypothetical protein
MQSPNFHRNGAVVIKTVGFLGKDIAHQGKHVRMWLWWLKFYILRFIGSESSEAGRMSKFSVYIYIHTLPKRLPRFLELDPKAPISM